MADQTPTIDSIVVTAKRPVKTEVVPNPLHDFASYTYNVSLWWLDMMDYNKLMLSTDPRDAMAWVPGVNSYCVAEDAGLYVDHRVPGTPGLNYNIQDIKFDTTIAPNKTSRSSNIVDGSMTIVEPYGVTWFETLLTASYDGKKFNNWARQPFMLQIDFKGYDDNGDPIPEAETAKLRKRFPISIVTANVNLTNKGAEYRLGFCSINALAHYPDYSSTPGKIWSITAGTVGEFFKELSAKYADYYFNLIVIGKAIYQESISFDIDPAISASPIVNDKELPISRASSKSKEIDLKKTTWTIPAGTPILDIINKVMAHSKYLIDDQLKLESGGKKSDYDIFSAFKTTTKIIYAHDDGENMIEGVIDPITNRPPRKIIYSIGPYTMFDSNHPELPQLPNSRPYTVKKYDYYYTGNNTDIINFKLEFDTTYYTAIQAYTSAIAASESSENTLGDELTVLTPPAEEKFNVAVAAGSIPNLTPLMFRNIVKDKEASSGFNLSSRPAAQISSDVLKSVFGNLNGDMVSLDLDIVGDPTLIKQDDWLYVPSPTGSETYYNLSQAEYVDLYGHIKTDDSQIVVAVRLNSPVDIDTDWADQGLMTPLPSYQRSVFSGQYKIITVSNKFSNGKFEQTLTLVRYINDDLIKALNPDTDAVTTSRENQTSTAAPNGSAATPTATPSTTTPANSTTNITVAPFGSGPPDTSLLKNTTSGDAARQ